MNQLQMVITALRRRKSRGLTSMDAFEFGCTRLAARIMELRNKGFDIHTEYEKSPTGCRYARYFLIKENSNG